MNSQIIIVCAETDRDSASQTGLPILRFGLGLTSNGTPIRTIAQNSIPGDILCISDFGISQQIPDEIIRQLTEEASDTGGIFADFERAVPQLDSFLSALDQTCAAADIPLFVPYKRCPPNAYAVVPGAASGGSLREELERGMMLRNGRIAVSFGPIRKRFYLPASDPEGEDLTEAELSAAQAKTGAHPFFSRELCANYFTYMEKNTGVFILYDTDDTLRLRLRLIQEIGVPYIFMEWNGCQNLLIRS